MSSSKSALSPTPPRILKSFRRASINIKKTKPSSYSRLDDHLQDSPLSVGVEVCHLNALSLFAQSKLLDVGRNEGSPFVRVLECDVLSDCAALEQGETIIILLPQNTG